MPASVAEVFLDHVREIAHREVDLGDAVPDEVQDDAFEDRTPGDAEHRLGNGLGQRSKAHATPAGHDHGRRVPGDGLQELVEKVQADRPAGVVDDGDRADRHGPASAPALPLGLSHVDTDESRRQDGSQQVVESRTVQQRSADVAVGQDADQRAAGSTASAIRRAPRSSASIASRSVPSSGHQTRGHVACSRDVPRRTATR